MKEHSVLYLCVYNVCRLGCWFDQELLIMPILFNCFSVSCMFEALVAYDVCSCHVFSS